MRKVTIKNCDLLRLFFFFFYQHMWSLQFILQAVPDLVKPRCSVAGGWWGTDSWLSWGSTNLLQKSKALQMPKGSGDLWVASLLSVTFSAFPQLKEGVIGTSRIKWQSWGSGCVSHICRLCTNSGVSFTAGTLKHRYCLSCLWMMLLGCKFPFLIMLFLDVFFLGHFWSHVTIREPWLSLKKWVLSPHFCREMLENLNS